MTTPVEILLVDDQPANLDALEAVLAGPDHALVRAETADQALMALLKHDFAAIVLDIRMPGVSGIELAELIKQRKRTQHIPIVFLTAHLMDDREVLRGYGVGAVDYLSKPINPEILRSKIAVFVDLFRKTRALAAANAALRWEVEERERAQAALRRANEELEARVRERTADLQQATAVAESANRAKDHFLAVLSHELRTPLTPALMTVQLLEREPSFHESTRQALGTIRRNIELEARLIDDLLDLTRVARGKLTLTLQDVDLHLILRQAMQTCAVDAAEKGVRVTSRITPELIRVRGDPARLQQVFWNIIKNAIKFTPPGGDIIVRTEAPKGGSELAVVSVQDTGVGIEPSRLSSIFDAFEQGSPDVTRKFGGLGLGLAISKSLVEMCGGHIRVYSDGPGQGSTFQVCLRTTDPIPADAPQSGPLGRPVTQSNQHDSARASALRILLVEDHDDSAAVMELILEGEGHSVYRAANVTSAISAAQTQEFDLIISDLGLPDGSGHEMMVRIRESKDIPGIALSGYGMDQDLKKSLESGFREHLTKPVNSDLLHAAIERVTAMKRRIAQRRP